jgi:hypothetical protein
MRPSPIFAVVILSLLVAFATPAFAQVVHRVGSGAHLTIQAAIDAAAPNDIVLVDAGVYPTFHVGKPLVITAVPSALVQVIAPSPVTIALAASHRVHLAGLDLEVAAVIAVGGLVSMERCTIRTEHGTLLIDTIGTLRWSAAFASQASGLVAFDSELHASDCTFGTGAAGVATIEHGGVTVLGSGECQLATCTLQGAWPTNAAALWPSVALHLSRAASTARTWLVDCQVQGGYHTTGVLGPSLVAAATGQARLRLHRTQVQGLAIGNVDTGPILGVHTPVDLAIGTSFVTTMRSEPGHLLTLYLGTDINGPTPLPFVAQAALGFHHLTFLPAVVAGASGAVDVALAVPNEPALRHSVLFWRGLDLSVAPIEAMPLFVTVAQ